MREAEIVRCTAETQIRLRLCLDGDGSFHGTSGIGFFDHMLTLLAVHGGFTIELDAKGDLDVDNHHTVEDIGIVLGEALSKALGDKKGIRRYGCFFCPMDEALSRIVIDLSGRSYLVYDVNIPVERIGSFETEMTRGIFHGTGGARCHESSRGLPVRHQRPSYRGVSVQGTGSCAGGGGIVPRR